MCCRLKVRHPGIYNVLFQGSAPGTASSVHTKCACGRRAGRFTLLQVVMARVPSPSHAAWRLPAWCASPFALRPRLPRLPSTTSAGSGMASGSDISLCLHSRLLPSVPRTPRPCTSESRWVDSGQRTRTPTNPVSECSAIAGLVALTTAASRWRHCVPFVPFAAPLCSLFPRRVTCAPFENFYFVILNPFFRRRRARNHSSPFPSRTPRICPMPALLRTGLLLCAAVQAPSAPVDANPRRDIEFASFAG